MKINSSTLLTIDDEAYIRNSIRSYFEDYGFTVFEADNGRAGIEIFEQEHPDIVLLDLRMPEMDGLEVLDILKKKAPGTPLIVASGTGNISAVVDALHLGAWDYILKPVQDMSVLLHSVTKCLKTRRLQMENRAYQERLEELVREKTAELAASEEKYRAVFECTGSATAILEKDMSISMVNKSFADLAGLPVEEIEGKKKWTDFVVPEDLEMMKIYHEQRRLAGTKSKIPWHYEFRFLQHNNKIKHIYLSVGMMPGRNQSVTSLLDITEKKNAEKRWKGLEVQLRKAQKMEAIGTLAGGIAHDLNNILSPVLGYADMIMRASKPDGTVFRRSGKIQKAAYRAADLVSQILLLSRKREEEARSVKLHPIAKEVITLLRGIIPSTIEIVDRIDRQCGHVEADPTQIHQVLMNLCTNAYHAMEEKGGKLVVSLKEAEISQENSLEYPELTKGRYLFLQVMDTGCGMEEQIMERIFDPYFTTKAESKGTGLGLATVYSIIKKYSGEISVKSVVGKGTSFTVMLPVVSEEFSSETKDEKFQISNKNHGESILVVDDDRDIADMYKEGFELLGYRVHIFYSPVDALIFFKVNYAGIDLVVTDQTMPGKTGFELAKDMLAIKEDLPVILCSGYTETINAQKAEDAGIKRFIMKPVAVDELSNVMQQVLNKECN
ncbi:MAG: response regulator [Thermodesulfobacteriota bacterium]|nr:response regulator [Thermodesulfobacteriota bacterium]